VKILRRLSLGLLFGLLAYRVLPGHTVTIGESAASPGDAPSTSNAFWVGYLERGPVDAPIKVISLTDAVEKAGDRLAADPTLYDSIDAAFREGASVIYLGRIVGPDAATAIGQLIDRDSLPTLGISATSEGDWGNDIKVSCVFDAGGTFILTVYYDGAIVEASPSLANAGEAVLWAQQNSAYIVLEDLTTAYESAEDPRTQDETLEGGDSDLTNATTTELEVALNLFRNDLGAGQVAAPGFTSSEVHDALLAHAVANNRRALLDLVDTDDEDTLAGVALALRAADDNGARFGGAFAPRFRIPGISAGTTRTVPYSAIQTGLIARAEGAGLTPNKAAAGKNGRCRYATGLTQDFTDAQREVLNDSGVNAAILIRGIPTTYGNRTLTNPTTDGDWKSFSASRLVMAVAAASAEVMADYDFEEIDGHGYVFKKLQGDLSGRACMPFYLANSLYGQTPEEAFNVNTGPDVNTPTTIAAEQIKAKVAIRVSSTGEMLLTEIVKVPITESL
jgi:phage tail sheath protein FI